MFFEAKNAAAVVLSVIVLSGCMADRDHAEDVVGGVAGWQKDRDRWVSKVRDLPMNSDSEILKLIKLSSSPLIEGPENEIHGRLLSEVKSLTGERWSYYLGRARYRDRENAITLVEAWERGAGFSLSPDMVVLSRKPRAEDGEGSVILDLGL